MSLNQLKIEKFKFLFDGSVLLSQEGEKYECFNFCNALLLWLSLRLILLIQCERLMCYD